MKAKALTLAAFLVISISLAAQENEKIKYSNVTELGYIAVSPKGVMLEVATVNGVAIDKQHHFGLGVGFGTNVFHTSFEKVFVFMPIFFNYRNYFKPERNFSPHLNVSLGGIAMEGGYGFYSSLTMGFRAKAFSFSSGLSFTPMYREVDTYHFVSNLKWTRLFGIVLKCGFTF